MIDAPTRRFHDVCYVDDHKNNDSITDVMDEVDDVIDDGLFCSIGSPDTIITDDALRHRVYNFLRSRGMRDDVLIVPPDYTRYHSRAGTITRYVAEYYDYVPRRRDRSPCDDSRDHGDDDEGEDVEDYDDDGNGKDAHVSDVSSADPPPPPAATTAISSETAIDDSHPVVPPVNIRIIPALGTHQPMTPIQLRKMFGDGLSDIRHSPFVVHDWREGVVSFGCNTAHLAVLDSSIFRSFGLFRLPPTPSYIYIYIYDID